MNNGAANSKRSVPVDAERERERERERDQLEAVQSVGVGWRQVMPEGHEERGDIDGFAVNVSA